MRAPVTSAPKRAAAPRQQRHQGARRLARLVAGALLAAESGCSVHHAPWNLYEVSLLDDAKPGAGGAGGLPLDEATCRAGCVAKADTELRCFAVTQRQPPPRATRTLACSRVGTSVFYVEVDPALAARADPKTRELDHAACLVPCGAESIDKVVSCSSEAEPPSPPAGTRLLLCRYTYPGWDESVDVLEPFRSVTRPLPSGRAPAGFTHARPPARDSVGAYFAEVAHLEAASVIAFRILASELRAHRAPLSLVRRAHRCARDEIAHSIVTGALARRFGATPRAPSSARGGTRPLVAIAIENAVEGCVGETFGAALAVHQASRARDPFVRRAMVRIARDEMRHASLAWDVHAFLEGRLSPREQRAVQSAMKAAADRLAEQPPSRSKSVAAATGLPSLAVSGALAKKLGELLWTSQDERCQ